MSSPTIGSYFEQARPEYYSQAVEAPWWNGHEHVTLAAGRHALLIAAEELLHRRARRIALPDYLCQTMVEPFAGRLDISFYPLTDSLEPRQGAFDAVQAGDAVLVCDYFGRKVPEGTVSEVARAHHRGVLVVSDTTHGPFTPPAWPFDLGVISLRKTLPLHDGAVLVGALIHPSKVSGTLSPDQVRSREAAATSKRICVEAGQDASGPAGHLSAFEAYLDTVREPTRMSSESATVLTMLDLAALARRRTDNSRALLKQLPVSAQPLPGYNESASAFVVVQVQSARLAQAALAAQGIFCPIHWPQPIELEGRPWRTDLLSIPVDHRYDADDMARIANALQDHLEAEKT